MSMTVIRSVDPRSPAHRAGLRPGETLLEVNGHPVADVLDYKFYTYDPKLALVLQEPNGNRRTVRVRKEEGEDLGLDFETYLMDRARSCANNCIFCFVDQMPPGMRKSLYFKDDDARLSFLMGNYLTLTNLSQREVERIIALRISPINVSVHTTDPELRSEMLKNKRAGEGIAIMRRFAQASITMNCQIVSCPGINDGPALDRTLLDLAGMAPAVNSISVVPVGVTKYREGLYPLRPYTQEEAAALIDQVEAFAAAHKAQHGTSLVWCSDEFYLLAGRPLPQEDYYEEFTQLDNGVGMLRLLRQEFSTPRAAHVEKAPGCPATQPKYTITFKEPVRAEELKYVVLAEDIAQGQRVESFRIAADFASGGQYALAQGTCIGHKKICQLRDPFALQNPLIDDSTPEIKQLTIHVTAARDEVLMKEILVY